MEETDTYTLRFVLAVPKGTPIEKVEELTHSVYSVIEANDTVLYVDGFMKALDVS